MLGSNLVPGHGQIRPVCRWKIQLTLGPSPTLASWTCGQIKCHRCCQNRPLRHRLHSCLCLRHLPPQLSPLLLASSRILAFVYPLLLLQQEHQNYPMCHYRHLHSPCCFHRRDDWMHHYQRGLPEKIQACQASQARQVPGVQTDLQKIRGVHRDRAS